MTRDELVAALKARTVSEAIIEAARRAWVKWDADDTKRWLIEKWQVSEQTAQAMIGEGLRDLGGTTGTSKVTTIALAAAQATDAEHLAEALDVAGRRAFSCSFEGGDYEDHEQHIYAAFLQSLTGTAAMVAGFRALCPRAVLRAGSGGTMEGDAGSQRR